VLPADHLAPWRHGLDDLASVEGLTTAGHHLPRGPRRPLAFVVHAEPILLPVPAAELTRGDGLQEVQIFCNTCHSPRYITMQPPLPDPTWAAEVKKMNETFGAGIPEDSAQKIILYLQAHYAVENRKP
jgi:mono/diheme cytochrome c family protein